MFNCMSIFLEWFNPPPLEIPSIKNLVLKPFEPPQPISPNMSSWNIIEEKNHS